jgi:hypothetical protein
MEEQNLNSVPGKWVKGMKSPNPQGRKMKYSSITIRGMVERFVKRNMTPKRIQVLYDQLSPKDKLEFITELLPYTLAKPQAGTDIDLTKLSNEQVDDLYSRVMSQVNNNTVKASA